MLRNSSTLVLLIALCISVVSCQKEQFEENMVPTVNAGDYQETTLPADSVTLTGLAEDADGKVVAYLWSQISGPSHSIIKNPGSQSTTVRRLKTGIYVFQLMATDEKGATGVDTVSIKVKEAVIKTLSLQPANNPGEAIVQIRAGQDLLVPTHTDIAMEAWTHTGANLTTRGLLKFDLSTIPVNATIVSANLYLYSQPAPVTNGNLVDANFGDDNTLLVQRITAAWTPVVAWSNQPATTTEDQVIAPSTDQSMLDLNLNVTAQVSDMIANNANYGFLFKLQHEVTYTSRIFVSSYNAGLPAKHPKLVVVYK